MGLFEKLKNGLKNTKDALASKITGVINSFTKIDEDFFEELEETLGVLLLLFGRLGEHACDLLVTLLFRLAGEEYVTAARLTFAGKRLQQILLGPCTFNALFHNLILFSVCRLFPYSKDRKIPDNSPNYLHRLFLYGYSDYL